MTMTVQEIRELLPTLLLPCLLVFRIQIIRTVGASFTKRSMCAGSKSVIRFISLQARRRDFCPGRVLPSPGIGKHLRLVASASWPEAGRYYRGNGMGDYTKLTLRAKLAPSCCGEVQKALAGCIQGSDEKYPRTNFSNAPVGRLY